jgi:hypothetical protein
MEYRHKSECTEKLGMVYVPVIPAHGRIMTSGQPELHSDILLS